MLSKLKNEFETETFCGAKILGQANFWGQAKILGQANFEAKSEARPTLKPGQANGAKSGQAGF